MDAQFLKNGKFRFEMKTDTCVSTSVFYNISEIFPLIKTHIFAVSAITQYDLRSLTA